jgi:D-alanyl-D-alanine carboxypeptidase (penicillin-binding protein 5/6)
METGMKHPFLCIVLTALCLVCAFGIKQTGLVSSWNVSAKTASGDTGSQPQLSLTAQSAVLMEPSTGTVLYKKDMHKKLRPASITKIMTLLLIFEAIEDGSIDLTDTVTVSAYAASMGGSQVFLEEGETQTVDTLIQCISIASANDACVAMAEYIAGSEEEFVSRMNQKAAELGMEDTHFVNCCGLDTDGHLTCAYDVALMSRELITKHPQIFDYCTIWQTDITHVTKKGSTPFTLTNTNKLIRQYEYATGLKTGSTSLAKYCVSATAKKDGISLIAVVMAASDYKVRFTDAATMLNYGFSNVSLYTDDTQKAPEPVTVTKSITNTLTVSYETPFTYLSTDGSDFSTIEKQWNLPESVEAPIAKGDIIGTVDYTLNGTIIGTVNLLADSDIAEATLKDRFFQILAQYLMAKQNIG